MANKNISIAEALQKVSKTAREYINKNTPHIISEDVILTIPASSIVKADYEAAKSNNEPYYVPITDTVAEEFNENNLYSVKFNEKEYKCVYTCIFGDEYTVNTDTMVIKIALDSEVASRSATVGPKPPYCAIYAIDINNITDIQLISKKVQRLDNMYLKRDLEVANSLTIGNRTGNIGEYSLASGDNVEASGSYSHAEGSDTTASGGYAHAEGCITKATNWGTHAEGCRSESIGMYSHAEGYDTRASSDYQHVQGKYNIEDAANKYAHIVGNGADDNKRSNAHTLDWKGNAWYAGDVQANNVPYVASEKVVLTVPAATITAKKTKIDNATEDNLVEISIDSAVTFDLTKSYYLKYNNIEYFALATESGCMIVGHGCYCGINSRNGTKMFIGTLDTTNITDMQLIEKDIRKLDNKYVPDDLKVSNSITLGARVGEIGEYSSSLGLRCESSGYCSHAEGSETIASEDSSHAEGYTTIASSFCSHAEGSATTASAECSHAEGYTTTASNHSSHAEGSETTASGLISHAEGSVTTASGECSHAEGRGTIAQGQNQHVQGKYNIEDTANKYAHIVGNGTGVDTKSNAHTLDWDGNGWYAGKLSQEGTPTEDKDLVTKKYVDEHSANIADGFIMNDQVNGYKYLIQMRGGVLTSTLTPTSISVDSSSGGVKSIEGEAIDLNSITFMANYPDGTSSQITDTENISYTPATLTTNVTKVTFVYNMGGLKLTYDMPITVTTFDPAVDLQDFEYTTNNDGTYTLTGWKGTHNGVASTELIIPNSKKIIL